MRINISLISPTKATRYTINNLILGFLMIYKVINQINQMLVKRTSTAI
jgi:hypothetical protein